MRHFWNFLLLTACAIGFFVSGCAGYQVGSVKPSVYANISKIHVPIFANDTLEPRLSSLVTNAVLKKLHVDGTYKVTTKAECDAILVGRISKVRKRQLRAVRTDTLRSRELNLYLDVYWHLEDPVTGERIQYASTIDATAGADRNNNNENAGLSRPGRVVGSTIQFVDPSFQISERNALSVASEDAAGKLVSQLSNGW